MAGRTLLLFLLGLHANLIVFFVLQILSTNASLIIEWAGLEIKLYIIVLCVCPL